MIITHDAPVSERVRRTVRIRGGRTATGALRTGAAGEGEEYAVLGRVARFPGPRGYTERCGPRRRERPTAVDDRIGVRPGGDTDQDGEDA